MSGSSGPCGSGPPLKSISRKTMSEPLRGIVVSHSGLAESLVAAVAAIAGVEDALLPVSNEGCDERALADRLTAAIGGKPAVLFVDLPGGPCLPGAARSPRGKRDLAVVAGVNLAIMPHFRFT